MFSILVPKKSEHYNQECVLDAMNMVKYCHKYWQLEVAILRYCRDKGQHLKSAEE